MYLLYKFVFILVILGNVSKLSAVPVKDRNVVFSEAAENTEMSGDGGHKVRRKKNDNFPTTLRYFLSFILKYVQRNACKYIQNFELIL